MKRVVIESPLASDTLEGVDFNKEYARACMRESLISYGEAPFASHLLYTQMLDDENPAQRMLGIEAGLEFVRDADLTVVYRDHGISSGMWRGIRAAEEAGRPIEHRSLGVIVGLGYYTEVSRLAWDLYCEETQTIIDPGAAEWAAKYGFAQLDPVTQAKYLAKAKMV
jgi:hypothetical protein